MTSMQEIMQYVVRGLISLLVLGWLVALWATHRRRPDDTEEVARQRLRKGQTIMCVLICAFGACCLAAEFIRPAPSAAYIWFMAILLFVLLALTTARLVGPKR